MARAPRQKMSYKHSVALACVSFAIACIVIGIFSLQYYIQLQTTIRSESSGYLQEISTRIGSNIDRIIIDNFAFLNTFSVSTEDADTTTFAQYRPLVDQQRSFWNFQDIILIDQMGKAYSSSGVLVKLGGDPSFLDAVVDNEQIISNALTVDNLERIALSIPLKNCTMDGTKMIAMAAIYEPASFDEALSMSSFGGQSFSCIIEKNGTVVIRSSASSAMEMGYNVLNTIEQADPNVHQYISAMKDNVAAERKGEITFERDGSRFYAIYTPISPENWYLLTFVPAEVVTARSDMMLGVTLLACGVITASFAILIAFLLLSATRNRRRLEQIAYVDNVTGGHTITRFYELAEQSLSKADHPRFALVYTNMEKFKVLNEQFGRRACDELLKMFTECIENGLDEDEFVGRQGADNFCILIKYKSEEVLRERLGGWYQYAENYYEENHPIWSLPIVEFGIFLIDNEEIPYPQMIDRAKLALREASVSIGNRMRYAIYNDEVRRLLFREKQLEDLMEHALAAGEFKVYLQPKYRLSDEKIGGAEALARWASESEGLIFPDEFIPLFEKNGFIIQLDLWIFEKTCRALRSWLDRGFDPIKVSINCSRVHLKNHRFLDPYCTIAARYSIPGELIEIELTESIVMEDSERLLQVIDDIHAVGFTCSIDDFGCGYSSLNMIQSIPVDTLKLDKIFFRDRTKDRGRTKSVVQSIISMARALNMQTVAEGVEYEDQIEMLREVGCDYAQGYVFARPMTIADFEELAFGETLKQGGDTA